jgi:hypothetical protein
MLLSLNTVSIVELEKMEEKIKGIFIAFLVTCLFLCSINVSLAKEDASINWEKTYGSGSVNSLVKTNDGGYAMAGSDGHSNLLIVKTDSDGNSQWNKSYSGIYWGTSMVQTTDGGFIIAGPPPLNSNASFHLVKTDSNGNIDWSQNVGNGTSPQWDISYVQVVETPDRGFAIATSSTLFKTDSDGNVQWNKTYNLVRGLETSIIALTLTSDGGYALAGCAAWRSMNHHATAFLCKTDSGGNIQWNNTYGLGYWDEFEHVIEIDGGSGYAMVGKTNDPFKGMWAIYSVTTNQLGDIQWNHTYDEVYNAQGGSYGDSIIESSNGGFAIAGFMSNNTGLLIKTDPSGIMQWQVTFDGYAHSLVGSSDGGYIMAGGTSVSGDNLISLIKVQDNSLPTVTPTPTCILKCVGLVFGGLIIAIIVIVAIALVLWKKHK